MKKLLYVPFLVSFLSGCQGVTDFSNSLSNGLNNTSKIISSLGNPGSESTNKSIDEALSKSSMNSSTQKMFTDASPSIKKFLALTSCNASASQLRTLADPDEGTFAMIDPLIGMKYHKSGCLNVTSISGVRKLSKNAIYFKVKYTSPQSDESTIRKYKAIKQESGEWLFAGSLI